ncbi:MAG TPA: chemotaxis protein CheB [Acidimicrobiales bacterium]|nr:chemotaxis protein CheB [Acidimicrobiales bacterium]
MPNRDVVVVGASAGGIEALKEVLAGLPADLPAAVLVVLHIPPAGGRSLPAILARATGLRVQAAEDGEPLEHGRAYVCVGDKHLLVGEEHVHVRRGPRENGHRPAVDPLFRSAARFHGPRVIGVVLSGTLSDGTAGLHAVKRRGGIAVVQDPADAMYGGMPASAIEYVRVDHVVPAAEIGPVICRLVKEPSGPEPEDPTALMRKEVALVEAGDGVLEREHPGRPSSWPCPDCSGVLWQIDDGPLLRFRCRVGHAWTAEALLEVQGDEVEAALWTALRALEDRAALSWALAGRAEHDGRRITAGRFKGEAEDVRRSIDVLRRLLGAGVGRAADAEGVGEPAEREGGPHERKSREGGR